MAAVTTTAVLVTLKSGEVMMGSMWKTFLLPDYLTALGIAVTVHVAVLTSSATSTLPWQSKLGYMR